MTIISTVNDYLYIGSLFIVGAFGAFAFTSYCVVNKDYKNLKQKIKNDEKKREEDELRQQKEDEENSYENKFSLKNAIHNKNHVELDEKYIFESTPDGVVILNYDIENKSFNYWSDNTIQYKYLQTVARRFVFDFQCKDYYIQCDEKDKKNHEKSKNVKDCENDLQCACDSDKCKLPGLEPLIDRDYNEAENDLKKMQSTKDDKKDDSDDVFVKTKKNGQKSFSIVANKYSHKGDLLDFYGPTSKKRAAKNISFAEFMKQKSE